jgi:periplasmic protein TonB
MKKYLHLVFLFIITVKVNAQEAIIPVGPDPIEPDTLNDVFDFAEVEPEFPGGMTALYNFIKKNIHYPTEAKELGIQGKVYVQFVIWKDGSIGDVKVMRGLGNGLDEEARRVIKIMPKWKPGQQNGKPVNMRYILPVSFKLE